MANQHRLAPLHPFVAQTEKCLGLHHPFRQRENDALFLVEMFARTQHGPQQQLARLFRAPRLLHLRQPGVNFVVLLVKRLALPDLRQAMLQRFHQQIVLGPGVRAHEHLQRGGQQFDLRQRLEARRGLFDMIEQIVEHHVFRHQNFRDFHGCIGLFLSALLKSHQPPPPFQPFLGFLLTTTRTGRIAWAFCRVAKRALEIQPRDPYARLPPIMKKTSPAPRASSRENSQSCHHRRRPQPADSAVANLGGPRRPVQIRPGHHRGRSAAGRHRGNLRGHLPRRPGRLCRRRRAARQSRSIRRATRAAGLRPRRACARQFTGNESFLLLVGDHLYVSRNKNSCARQLVEIAAAEACAVSAVQATHESKLPYYGAVGGGGCRAAPGCTRWIACWKNPRPPWPNKNSSCPVCAPAITFVFSACTC